MQKNSKPGKSNNGQEDNCGCPDGAHTPIGSSQPQYGSCAAKHCLEKNTQVYPELDDSIHPSIHPSCLVNPELDDNIHPSIHPSIHRPVIHPSIHPSIHLVW